MKYLYLVINSLLLSYFLGLTHESKSIDTNLAQYYVKFIDISKQCDVKVNDVNLRMEFNDKLYKSNWVGECIYQDNLVVVNRLIWKRLASFEKEQVIYHELGHCLLNKRHDEDGLNLMNAEGYIPKALYTENYDYFIRRLFKNCNKPLIEKFKYEEIK